MIKNIIFDFGGVLVDWNPHHLFSYALRHVIIQSCIIKICVASIPFALMTEKKVRFEAPMPKEFTRVVHKYTLLIIAKPMLGGDC